MNWQSARAVLEEAVRLAGQAVLNEARQGFALAHKANADPVTSADLAANRILRARLQEAFPETGWLSEETRPDPARLGQRWVWIVDPIDGTKEFVDGVPEYAVSVALVEDGRPVLSAVYNPAAGECFVAVRGEGAWLNGEPLKATRPCSERPVLLASRSEIKRGEFAPFAPLAEIRPVGSIAYKLALIAAGRADATFSLGPKNEWDIAGGVLLVEAAGGTAVDAAGQPFVFNRADTLVDGVVATCAGQYPRIARLIEQGRVGR